VQLEPRARIAADVREYSRIFPITQPPKELPAAQVNGLLDRGIIP
jgi:hypothetical protein